MLSIQPVIDWSGPALKNVAKSLRYLLLEMADHPEIENNLESLETAIRMALRLPDDAGNTPDEPKSAQSLTLPYKPRICSSQNVPFLICRKVIFLPGAIHARSEAHT